MQIDPIKLKTAREAAKLHFRDVAVAADMSEKRIQQLEKGISPKVNLNVAKAIARVLRVKVDELEVEEVA